VRTSTSSYRIPLPYATASIALWVDCIFPNNLGPVLTTLIGFAVGILILYFSLVFRNTEWSSPRPVLLAKGRPIER